MLTEMALNLDKPQNPERLKLFCKNLEEYPIEKIEASSKWHMANSKFFTQLAEIRERLTSKQSI